MKNEFKFLYSNYLLHVDMIECITNQGYRVIESNNKGILISDKDNIVVMLSAIDINSGKEFISKIPKEAKMIVAHQEFYINYLKEIFNVIDEMKCYQSVYTKKSPLTIENSNIEIRILNEEYAEYVFNNYSSKDTIDIEYIRDRINTNTMLGAFIDENLVGFIGTHEEGSIGILEVLPYYRNRGIGECLQKYATNLALSQDRIPYGQIKINNLNSIRLQERLGFEISEDIVYWLMIE